MHAGETLARLASLIYDGDLVPVFKNDNAGSPVVFTINEAKVYKIGRLVVASFDVTRNDATVLSGAVTWSLPYPSDGSSAAILACGQFWATGKAIGPVVLDNFANNIANGVVSASGSVNTYLKFTDIANADRFGMTMVYRGAP